MVRRVRTVRTNKEIIRGSVLWPEIFFIGVTAHHSAPTLTCTVVFMDELPDSDCVTTNTSALTACIGNTMLIAGWYDNTGQYVESLIQGAFFFLLPFTSSSFVVVNPTSLWPM